MLFREVIADITVVGQLFVFSLLFSSLPNIGSLTVSTFDSVHCSLFYCFNVCCYCSVSSSNPLCLGQAGDFQRGKSIRMKLSLTVLLER